MSTEELVRYILSFLGGGLVSAIGNWVYSAWSARRAREAEWLRDQLRLLYGPLFFLTRHNEQLFKLTRGIHDAYGEHFIGKNWSTDERTQSSVRDEAMATINLGNTYIELVVQNNACVVSLLKENWHLVAPEDIEVLSQFQVDCTRYAIEANSASGKGVPFEVLTKLGEISFMRPEVINQVRETFYRKRARLLKLAGVKEF